MHLKRPSSLKSLTPWSPRPRRLQLGRTLNIAECPPSTQKGLALNVTSPIQSPHLEMQSWTGLLASVKTAALAGETRMPLPPPHREGAAPTLPSEARTAAAASPALPAGLLLG